MSALVSLANEFRLPVFHERRETEILHYYTYPYVHPALPFQASGCAGWGISCQCVRTMKSYISTSTRFRLAPLFYGASNIFVKNARAARSTHRRLTSVNDHFAV